MSHRLSLQGVVGESMIHIIEPVASQAVTYLIEKLGVKHLMEEVHLVSDFRETSKTTDEKGNPKLPDYRCTARLIPSVNPRNNKWEGQKTTVDLGNGNTLIRHGDRLARKHAWTGRDFVDREYSVFHDPKHFINIQQWDVGSSLQLEVRLDFHDFTPAQQCLSNLFAIFTNGEMVDYIPIQYDYPIPKDIACALFHLFSLTDLPKTNEAFKEWLTTNSNGQITWNYNRNDLRRVEMVGLRNNVHAMFMLENSQDAPEVRGQLYSININMTVQYSRTNRLYMMYPVIVNQKAVSPDMIPMAENLRKLNNGAIQWQNIAVNQMWHQLYAKGIRQPIHYPWWDGWTIPEESIVTGRGYQPVLIAALTLDNPDDPNGTTTIDLKDGLPGYKLSDNMLQILEDEGDRVLDHFSSYLDITVFAHDDPLCRHLLVLDGTKLTLLARDKDPIYRLCISVNPKPANHKPLKDAFEIIEEVRYNNENAPADATLQETTHKDYEERPGYNGATVLAATITTKKEEK